MSEAARSLVSASLSGAAAKDKIEAVAVELLSGGSVADANAMAATVLVEKVILYNFTLYFIIKLNMFYYNIF